MKKIRAIVLVMCVLFICTACDNKEKSPSMYIDKINIPQDGLKIIELEGEDADADKFAAYNFKVDDRIKSIEIKMYELDNDKWSEITASSEEFKAPEGKIGISINNITRECRVLLQGNNISGEKYHASQIINADENVGIGLTYIDDIEEIVYEKEIPLFIQTQTSNREYMSYGIKSFYKPEQYVQHGYEHVYAITLKFSKKEAQ